MDEKLLTWLDAKRAAITERHKLAALEACPGRERRPAVTDRRYSGGQPNLCLMFGMGAAGELAEEGPTFILQNVDQAHARRVEPLHSHFFNQPVKPEPRMRLFFCSGDRSLPWKGSPRG